MDPSMRRSIVRAVRGTPQCSGVDVRGVPDVARRDLADDGHHGDHEEDGMALIKVTVIAGVFTAPQKQEIVERLTDAMVEIQGENMRGLTWCVVEEVASGDWGIGGQTPTADDVKALARGEVAGEQR
jgi:4-oxalocrotonate tautomerase